MVLREKWLPLPFFIFSIVFFPHFPLRKRLTNDRFPSVKWVGESVSSSAKVSHFHFPHLFQTENLYGKGRVYLKKKSIRIHGSLYLLYIRWIGVHFVSCCFPTEMSPLWSGYITSPLCSRSTGERSALCIVSFNNSLREYESRVVFFFVCTQRSAVRRKMSTRVLWNGLFLFKTWRAVAVHRWNIQTSLFYSHKNPTDDFNEPVNVL